MFHRPFHTPHPTLLIHPISSRLTFASAAGFTFPLVKKAPPSTTTSRTSEEKVGSDWMAWEGEGRWGMGQEEGGHRETNRMWAEEGTNCQCNQLLLTTRGGHAPIHPHTLPSTCIVTRHHRGVGGK